MPDGIIRVRLYVGDRGIRDVVKMGRALLVVINLNINPIVIYIQIVAIVIAKDIASCTMVAHLNFLSVVQVDGADNLVGIATVFLHFLQRIVFIVDVCRIAHPFRYVLEFLLQSLFF